MPFLTLLFTRPVNTPLLVECLELAPLALEVVKDIIAGYDHHLSALLSSLRIAGI